MNTVVSTSAVPTERGIIEIDFDNCLSKLDVDVAAVSELIEIRTVPKGRYLVREGETAGACYFVLKGCVRQYYLVDGEEKTTFFYTEGHSIFSLRGPSAGKASNHYLACVEDTTLTVLTLEKEREMYSRFPELESMSRISLQEELSNYQEMLATYITTSPEERYLNLLESRPDLLNRVPQYQLASYLGVKPESLSRIRRRIIGNRR